MAEPEKADQPKKEENEKIDENPKEIFYGDDFILKAKTKFITVYLEAEKRIWRIFTPSALEFFDWFKNHAPFTPEEKSILSPSESKNEPESFTKRQKKRLSRLLSKKRKI